MLCRLLLLFLLRLFQRSSSSIRSTLGLCSGAGDLATRTPNSTPHVRAARRTPVSLIGTLRMAAVEQSLHTHAATAAETAAAALQQPQQQQKLILFKPHFASKPLVFSYFPFSVFKLLYSADATTLSANLIFAVAHHGKTSSWNGETEGTPSCKIDF